MKSSSICQLLLFHAIICMMNYYYYMLIVVGGLDIERDIKLHHVRSQQNASYVSQVNVSAANNAIYVDFQLLHTLDDLELQVELQYRLKDASNYQCIVTFNLNLCRFYTQPVYGVSSGGWLKQLILHSNFPTACPIKQGHYNINKLVMSSNLLPVYLPPGDYQVIARYFKPMQQVSHFVAQLQLDLHMQEIY